MENLFVQLALILVVSSFFGFLMLRFKLPLIVSYLLAGVALSFFSFFDTSQSLILHVFPDIGIAFVLFLIGMELDFREIQALGKPILLSGLGQILITTLLGFTLAQLFGFNSVESFYIGLGLSISSTVVVIKMLLEKRDVTSLYGKLSIGISLVEDLVSIIALMFISITGSALTLGIQQGVTIGLLIMKAAGLFALTYLLSEYILPFIFDNVAKSTELLFFTAIAWCFLFTAFAQSMGFSVEIGAFLAGVALASSPYHFQIQGKIKPLRDFFLALFFIYLGSRVQLADLSAGIPMIILFTLCAILFKPLMYLLLIGNFGFKKHTLFQTALNLSQISEFSLIILVVGVNLGIVSSLTLSIMAAVGVLSITISAILISQSRKIYSLIYPIIRFFERSEHVHDLESFEDKELENHIILIGAHHIGEPIVEFLKTQSVPFIVMDSNPHLVKELQRKGIYAVYGDIADPDVLDMLHVEKAQLIISTVSYEQDNEMLLEELKRRHVHSIIIVRGEDREHGKALKAMGADYVILPEKVSGNYLVNQIKDRWPTAEFPGLE